jgi:flagellar basal-body rod modification protein FlgD
MLTATALGAAAGIANSAVSALTNPAASTVQTNPKSQLTQSDFLNLLTKQLTTQDPTQPFDSSSMLQQMANLTSLNSSQSLKEAITSLQSNLGNTQLFQASQVVGKNVQLSSVMSPLTNNGLGGSVILNSNASNVNLAIQDATGKTVKTLNLGNLGPGNTDFKWNGIQDDGTAAPPGLYKLAASGTIQGQNTILPTAGNFNVSSVNMNTKGQGIQLNVENVGQVNLSEIIKIM